MSLCLIACPRMVSPATLTITLVEGRRSWQRYSHRAACGEAVEASRIEREPSVGLASLLSSYLAQPRLAPVVGRMARWLVCRRSGKPRIGQGTARTAAWVVDRAWTKELCRPATFWTCGWTKTLVPPPRVFCPVSSGAKGSSAFVRSAKLT